MEISKIKKITKISIDSKRYDIEVADTHNFFANNILVHNSNFRCGYVPIHDNKGWKRLFKIIRSWFDKKNFKYKGYEFIFGSHNVQLQKKNKFNKQCSKITTKHFKKNVYEEIVDKYDLRNKILPGHVIYGEIYGANIQKGYNYGLKDSIDLQVFDVMEDDEWLGFHTAKAFANSYGLNFVPVLFYGYFKDVANKLTSFFNGCSCLSKSQKVREGFVIRSVNEKRSYMGRKVLKYINPEYLLKKGNSDWH